MKKIINHFTLKPRYLFLLDAAGAFVTSFLVFGILRTFNEYIGMSKTTLTGLSIIALSFGFYSITCFFLFNNNWRIFLRAISIANIFYCLLTLGLILYYSHSITGIGIGYFIAEMAVVGVLIFIELNVSKNTNK